MSPFRRNLVLTGCALLFGSSVLAQEAPRVDVVKIMSFSCNVCLSAEAQDRAIAQVVRAKGGRFVWAPVPTQEEDSGARERVYYAARDLDPEIGAAVKESIYKGTQERGIPLFDFMQVYTWLVQDVPQFQDKFDAVFKKAQAPESKNSVGRAFQLAQSAGAQALPTYIILVNGRLDTSLDPSTSKSGTLTSLRDAVISRVETLTKEAKK